MSATATACIDCGLFHVGGPHDRPCDYPRLIEVVGEIEITAERDRFLRWLAGSDQVETALELFRELRGPSDG